MKKTLALILALCMIFALCACGQSAQTAAPAAEAPAAEAPAAEAPAETGFTGSDLIPVVDGVAEIMCGATTTGGWTYLYTSSACKVVSDNCDDINMTAQITTGGGENLVSVASGVMPCGVAAAAYIYTYLNGDPAQNIAPNPQLKTLYGSPSSTLCVIVPKDSPAQTIEDLKGKRVSICNKGNSGELLCEELLQAMGRWDNNYYDLQYLSPSESAEAMKNGEIDALWICCCAPHTSVTEIFNMLGGARLIEFSEDQMKLFKETCTYLADSTLPAGTYNGQDYDYHSVGSPYALIVDDSFPEELAYEIAKTLNENYDEWQEVFAGVKGATAQATIDNAIAPLHPGTERYFKEIGLLK